MGLETAHAPTLAQLNKRIDLAGFARAATFLKNHEIDLRVFVLIKPPFLTDEAEALYWSNRSLEFAFQQGASVAALIPVRGGNGALEALGEAGHFAIPSLPLIEAALDYGIGLKAGRVFADTWDLAKFSRCPACFQARQARIEAMNRQQLRLPAVECGADCPEAPSAPAVLPLARSPEPIDG